MGIGEDTLLDAIETSLYLLPELPGRVDWLSVPGMRGRITAGSDFFANLVGAATLDAQNADETIRQVYDLFAGQNKEFGWIVGPRSTPADLAGRLQGAGLEKIVIPHQPIVVLFCAATLEAYRGQGVYTSLVARRLADAHSDGAQAAVIQAVRTTSAPICQKLGFVEMCGLEWYAWFPEETVPA